MTTCSWGRRVPGNGRTTISPPRGLCPRNRWPRRSAQTARRGAGKRRRTARPSRGSWPERCPPAAPVAVPPGHDKGQRRAHRPVPLVTASSTWTSWPWTMAGTARASSTVVGARAAPCGRSAAAGGGGAGAQPPARPDSGARSSRAKAGWPCAHLAQQIRAADHFVQAAGTRAARGSRAPPGPRSSMKAITFSGVPRNFCAQLRLAASRRRRGSCWCGTPGP